MLESRPIFGKSTARNKAELISDFDQLSFGTLRHRPPMGHRRVRFGDARLLGNIGQGFERHEIA
jgi:hypothetical protein